MARRSLDRPLDFLAGNTVKAVKMAVFTASRRRPNQAFIALFAIWIVDMHHIAKIHLYTQPVLRPFPGTARGQAKVGASFL